MKGIRLGDVCEKIGSGATPRGGNEVYQSSGISLIRSQNVYSDGFKKDGLAYISDKHARELENVIVQAGDVLLNITGDSVARVCQVPKEVLPARVNQHVTIIRPHEDILDARYLRYFLVSPSMQQYMHALAASGATRQALTKGMIEAFEIPDLPLPEQKAIASILGALDDKIELNRKMNETLEAMARAIFKSWFVDFDPIPGFGPHKEWQDSPLGRIPKGWRVGTLGELCEIVMGQSPPGETYNEIGEGLLFYQGIRDFGFRFPAERVYCTSPTRVAQAGDVLLSVRAPVGSLNIAGEDCAIGRGVAALRIKGQHYGFLYYLMKETQWEWAKFEAEGTVFGAATKTDVQNFPIIFPTTEIILCFNQIVFPIDQVIKNNETQSRTLASIRDALLPKLLSGEIRVKYAERFLETFTEKV